MSIIESKNENQFIFVMAKLKNGPEFRLNLKSLNINLTFIAGKMEKYEDYR
jgi:hypothetical protein